MRIDRDGTAPVVAIIQARMSSTRLPGKVMKQICSRSVLGHVVDRLSRSGRIDKIVVATSTDPSDDVIERWCSEERMRVFRGSLHDVLSRYYWAARAYGARTIVRVTADCPLIDPVVVDRVIDMYLSQGCDYARTDETYPNGLDVEVFSIEALLKAFNEADLPSEREHVTPYIWKRPELFRVKRAVCEKNLAAMRWTIDDMKDFRLVEAIFNGLYSKGTVAHMGEIVEFLSANPALLKINEGTKRNEGYAKSLMEESAARAS